MVPEYRRSELPMRIDPAAFEALQALALGFAFAGLLASGFEFVFERRASFGLLKTGDLLAVVCVPLIVFSAPFIILRNTILGRRLERRPFVSVMLATVIACVWSLMSGRLVLDVTHIIVGA
jgi:hypothetical protein